MRPRLETQPRKRACRWSSWWTSFCTTPFGPRRFSVRADEDVGRAGADERVDEPLREAAVDLGRACAATSGGGRGAGSRRRRRGRSGATRGRGRRSAGRTRRRAAGTGRRRRPAGSPGTRLRNAARASEHAVDGAVGGVAAPDAVRALLEDGIPGEVVEAGRAGRGRRRRGARGRTGGRARATAGGPAGRRTRWAAARAP